MVRGGILFCYAACCLAFRAAVAEVWVPSTPPVSMVGARFGGAALSATFCPAPGFRLPVSQWPGCRWASFWPPPSEWGFGCGSAAPGLRQRLCCCGVRCCLRGVVAEAARWRCRWRCQISDAFLWTRGAGWQQSVPRQRSRYRPAGGGDGLFR